MPDNFKDHTMYLHITPTRFIADVQKEFNDKFPFLKLEFFQKRPSAPGLPLKKIIVLNQSLKDIQPGIHDDSTVEIRENMKVEDLENIFKDQLGLIIQVFRRSGNVWLETTMTDKWTLDHQNEHGKEISAVDIKTLPNDENYDLNKDADH